MKIRHLSVKNFRGIRSLDFTVKGDFICLIGAGDSCKTTILDAICYGLSSQWNIPINDLDFYDSNPANTIEIRVTIGNIPDEFIDQEKYGLYLRGWKDGKLIDEPTSESEVVLTIKCEIDHSFEPKWIVTTDRKPDGKHISYSDRSKIGAIKLDAFNERNFTWSKHSLLSRLTDNAPDGITATLASVGRTAKQGFQQNSLGSLNELTEPILNSARKFGISVSEIKPHLDIISLSVTTGGISLHENSIPLRKFGSGSKRLLSYAISSMVHGGKNILLIDEMEVGLEPNRVIRLVRNLKSQAEQQDFLTTHSPVLLRELTIDDIYVVHKRETGIVAELISEGMDTFNRDRLQALVRTSAESFLSQRILVCEGKTEFGFAKALDDFWTRTTNQSFSSFGVSLLDGCGSSQFDFSKRIALLGYQTALFCDSDIPETARLVSEVSSVGVQAIYWSQPVSTEQRVFLDLSDQGVNKAIDLAVATWGEVLIFNQLKSVFPSVPSQRSAWQITPQFRIALGGVAKESDWFKNISLGEELGKIVMDDLLNIPSTDLAAKIAEIKTWVHGNASAT